jgi:uncharacterized membrane protein (DUF4010 family)
MSGITGWLWIQQAQLLAVVLAAGATGLIVAAYAASARQDRDATTEMAALVVLAAGIAGGVGYWALTGAITAVTTLLLVEKSRIHDIARRLDDTTIRAGVRFGVMAVVILPLLPEGPYGPWGGFRPRTLWTAVLMFSALSFAAYVLRKALRGAMGYALTGLLGGAISSTGIAFAFSRLSRTEKEQDVPLALGVVGASTILFARVLVATAILNPGLARSVLPFFVLPFAAGALVSVLALWRARKTKSEPKSDNRNPLQFWTSLQMAGLFQAVLYGVYWLNTTIGDRGMLIWGAILGLTDVDALTLAMTRGGFQGPATVAATALSVGILSNTLFKAGIVLALGRGRYRWLAGMGLLVLGAILGLSVLML